jgi:hypothetical protein
MPRFRPGTKSTPAVRLSAPTDLVYATTDVGKGGNWIPRGTPVSRSHPFVKDLPEHFEVRYRLSEEVEHPADGA